ncbi:hypothetical protein F0562_020848 [Nyssa sinensis]|uniref:Uncharacterized protein n=1 Tax=Nyssa sinensis TaxID=561372 RepID=A0A5J5BWK7_9ASTE|nr:hypothetical protein F0562_020848 [Nyssa sinensis]
MVQALLEDAVKQQVTKKSVEVWLLKLKDAAYESEDLLDELAVEIMQCQSCSSITDKVRSFLLSFKPSRRLFDIASELQNKLEVLDDIAKEGFTLNLREGVVIRQTGSLSHGLAPSNLARTRHSSIVCNFGPSFPPHLCKATHLRTLLFLYPGGNSEELPSSLLVSFIYLRVLDLSGCGIKTVQKSISNLICLRYLDLSNTSIQTLPHTISDLHNLQTLNLSGCDNLRELPFGMGKVTSLRHLNTTGCQGLICMPSGIGKLVHLLTLPIYIVGKGTGESIAELDLSKPKG